MDGQIAVEMRSSLLVETADLRPIFDTSEAMPVISTIRFHRRGCLRILVLIGWITFFASGVAGQTTQPAHPRQWFNKTDRARESEQRDSALIFAYQAVKSALELRTDSAEFYQGMAHQRLGRELQYFDRYDSAMVSFTDALRIFEAIDSREQTAETLGLIGQLHTVLGEFDQAGEYLQQALKLAEDGGFDKVRYATVHQLGVWHQKQGQCDEAKHYYRQALDYAIVQKDLKKQGVLSGNIGSCLVSQDSLSLGIAWLREALRLKKLGQASPKSAMHTLNDLAEASLAAGEPVQAETYVRKVISLADSLDDAYSLKWGFFFLARASRDQRNWENAYRAQSRYISLSDSLFNLEKSKQIAELQVAYNTEKKDAEIAQLAKENEAAEFQRKLYILVGGLFLVLGVLLYNRQRMETRKNKELLEKELEVDRLKRQFFTNISHEFKTPLTLLLGPVETLLERAENHEDRVLLSQMQRNAKRLLQLVNDIIDLARFDAGQLRLQLEPVDWMGWMSGIAHQFDSLASDKGIDYEISIEGSKSAIRIDRSKVETMVTNLLSNAFKFTDRGGRVSFTARLAHDQANLLHIAVSDTGPGIPSEQLERVFDRYYQLENHRRSNLGGSGIGLSFTKEMVNLHGGNIAIDSVVGQGTTVTIVLYPEPAVETNALLVHEGYSEVSMTTETRASKEISTSGNASLPLLVVVEDSSDVRSYIIQVLKHHFTILEVADGESGLLLIREAIPDLIISDVMMPGLDGFELCSAVKSDERTCHIPLILLTAKGSDDSRLEGLERQADVYLSKPFLPKELILQAQNLIRSREVIKQRYDKRRGLVAEDLSSTSLDQQFINKLQATLEKQYTDSEWTVEALAGELGLSRSHLHRKLTALVGESATQVMRHFRLQRAHQRLQQRSGTVSEIAFDVGFNSLSYFHRSFQEVYGCSPGELAQ
jgi:signal transduction histidine kinase/DNA-binding response OmpR family regulator